MAVAKIAISLPAPLVTRIDRLAKKSGLSRSAVVREVVERTLNESTETEVLFGKPGASIARSAKRTEHWQRPFEMS